MIPKSVKRFSEKIMLKQKIVQASNVTVTGTWSDGRSQPRASLATLIDDSRSPSPCDTQM
jgi:hypothetical protein